MSKRSFDEDEEEHSKPKQQTRRKSKDEIITFSGLDSLADILGFTQRFQDEPFAADDQPTPLDVSNAPVQASGDVSTPSTLPTSSPASKSATASGSSRSSRSSNSSLSPKAIKAMVDEYELNFAAYCNERWMLPSGACVDELIADHVRTLKKEVALHSFVIDDPTVILALASDPEDKAALNEVLVKRDSERTSLVSPEKREYLRRFDKDPADIRQMLARGWHHVGEADNELPDEAFREAAHIALLHIHVVYRNFQFRLPEAASESFYMQTLWGFIGTLILCDNALNFRPGEVHSQASSLRKNLHRGPESPNKQAVGRKVDGLIVTSVSLAEICLIEAARRDSGPNGTKAQSDTRKLAKGLKDSFDAICAKASTDISPHLVVYGLRVAGPSLTFYSLRKLPGRLYQMVNDGCVTFPAVWNRTATITILTIVASVLALQERVSAMARRVEEWTSLSFKPLLTSNHPKMPRTLTTPPGSPRHTP
ncbi:hypothetical protein BGW41_004576 [Actinomortierella wolfii]|nr:hypothetical protein BGW41_004576 [Actinomortierella wolfii]